MLTFPNTSTIDPKARTNLKKDISRRRVPKDIPPASENESDNSSEIEVEFFHLSI